MKVFTERSADESQQFTTAKYEPSVRVFVSFGAYLITVS
jgi:hypothetical protein